MIELKVIGVRAVIRQLTRMGAKASSDAAWQTVLRPVLETLKQYARGISPVVTGAYQAAHTVTVRSKQGRLSNAIHYAEPVEERHGVYGRTLVMARGLLPGMEIKLIRGITE